MDSSRWEAVRSFVGRALLPVPHNPTRQRGCRLDPRKSSLTLRVAMRCGIAMFIAATVVGCTSGRSFTGASISHAQATRGQNPTAPTGARTHNPQAVKELRTAIEQYRAGKLDQALANVMSARGIDPTLIETYLWEVEIRFDLGSRDQYRRSLVEALKATQEQAGAQNSLGKRCLDSGLEEEGIAALGRAVRLSRRSPEFVHDMAAALVERGFTDEASEVLKDAMLRMPHVTSLQLSAASLEEKQGHWAAAARLYDVTIKHEPANLNARRQRARCLYQTGDYARAAQDYEICLGRKDRLISLNDYVQLGDALLRANDPVRAQTVFDRISKRLPVPSKDVELLRAISRIKTETRDEARVILNESIARWPSEKNFKTALMLCNGESPTQLVGHTAPPITIDSLLDEPMSP